VQVRTTIRHDAAAAAKAVRQGWVLGTRRAANKIIADVRRQARRAMPKAKKLPKILRRKDRAEGGQVVEIAVRSYAIYRKRRGGPVDLYTVHGMGGVVSGRGGQFLALPTEWAPRGRGGLPMPYAEAADRFKLTLLPSRRGGYVAVRRPQDGRRGERSPVWYVLTKKARLPKRLNLDAPVQREVAKWPDYVVAEVEKLDRRAAITGRY
jgi:hypothetical protein